MEQAQDGIVVAERAGEDFASERGADFDAKKAAYEAANEKLLRLTEMADKSVSVEEYKAQIRKALAASRRAHKALLAAWA